MTSPFRSQALRLNAAATPSGPTNIVGHRPGARHGADTPLFVSTSQR